jgi:acetate kinase
MQVLVINSGSSSVKVRLMEVTEETTTVQNCEPPLLRAAVKGIGSLATVEISGRDIEPATATTQIQDHAHALHILFDRLSGSLDNIKAVGHRVVHGGERYAQPTLITQEVEAGIDS